VSTAFASWVLDNQLIRKFLQGGVNKLHRSVDYDCAFCGFYAEMAALSELGLTECFWILGRVDLVQNIDMYRKQQ
jgi:hypothetical protein